MKKRILAVEDNADTCTLLMHLLQKEYAIESVSSAEEAIEKAGEQQYDLFLVDINLGKGISGDQLIHLIRKMPQYEHVPMIAVTAYAMPGDRDRFLAEGFDAYVSKPFTRQYLSNWIKVLLVSGI